VPERVGVAEAVATTVGVADAAPVAVGVRVSKPVEVGVGSPVTSTVAPKKWIAQTYG
jgi:hypothetical protein